jgi:hypothetical protein
MSGVGMLMTATSLLAACAVDGGQLSPDRSTTTEESSVTSEEFTIRNASAEDSAVAPAANHCRRVTASSIPVYTTATGSTVRCRFLNGDVFQYFLVGSPPLRFLSWCPRNVPASQGEFSWAQGSGTVEVTCPF